MWGAAMIYKQISFFALLLFLTSCMVGPIYKRPAVKIPAQYTNQKYSGVAELAQWWRFFQDPYLERLIEKAIAQNYDLRIAIEKIQQTRDEYEIKVADLFPELDGVGLVTRNRFSYNVIQALAAQNLAQTTQNNQSIVFSNAVQNPYSFFDLGFDASWELDVWGKLRHARNAAYDQYQAQIWAMRDVYIMLLSEVVKTYIDSRAFQKKIDLTNQLVEIDTKLLALTKDRFQSGIASDIPDEQQLQIIEQEKSQLILLDMELTQTIIKLAILLSENPEDFSLKDGQHEVPKSQYTLTSGLPSDLLRRRPDIRQAERLLAAATENVGVAVSEWFPSFTLLGSLGVETFCANNWFSNCSLAWSIGPSMLWRLITFGRIKYNVMAKESIQRQALLKYAESVVTALGDVEYWLVAYFKQQESLELLVRKLAAAKRERDLIKELFTSGLESEIQFLTAQKNYLSVELQITDSRQAVSIALVSVYKALGGGW